MLPAVRITVEESGMWWYCLIVFFWLLAVLKKVKRDKSVLILLFLDLPDLKIRSRCTENHCKLLFFVSLRTPPSPDDMKGLFLKPLLLMLQLF